MRNQKLCYLAVPSTNGTRCKEAIKRIRNTNICSYNFTIQRHYTMLSNILKHMSTQAEPQKNIDAAAQNRDIGPLKLGGSSFSLVFGCFQNGHIQVKIGGNENTEFNIFLSNFLSKFQGFLAEIWTISEGGINKNILRSFTK